MEAGGPSPELVAELEDWLRIPSVSMGDVDSAAMARAVDWVCERIIAAGGEAERSTVHGGNPLAVGELRSGSENAPTVLIYGHYDVQSIGDPGAWTSPPFEPQIRDGRIYARGAADDKGNFLPLLHVACERARAGTLPVNVRVLVEGEEESAGESASRWLEADERGADCAIVFDAGPADETTPAIILGLRGSVLAKIEVRTGERDLHSGTYGGSVLNALHVVQAMLSEVVPDPDGWVREELRAGIERPSEAERRSWERLKPGDEVIAEVGGRPVHPGAGAEYYLRSGADASLDVNEISGGEPRTIVPARAQATLSLRLAPGQRAEEMSAVLEDLLRSAVPDGADVDLSLFATEPSLCDPASPAVQLAVEALGRAAGVEPVLTREGGSIPIVAEFLARGIPTIVSGFSLPDDAIHAPDESYRLESLRLGERSAHELYDAMARLPV